MLKLQIGESIFKQQLHIEKKFAPYFEILSLFFFNNRCKFRLQLLNNNQLFGITSFQKGNRVSVGYICICTMNFLKSV